MAELFALLVPVIVGIVVRWLDRPAKPVDVGGMAGHARGIRAMLDRMRQASGRSTVG